MANGGFYDIQPSLNYPSQSISLTLLILSSAAVAVMASDVDGIESVCRLAKMALSPFKISTITSYLKFCQWKTFLNSLSLPLFPVRTKNAEIESHLEQIFKSN